MTRVAAVCVCVVLGAARVTGAADAIQIATAARAVQPGEVVVFTATAVTPIDSLHARAFGRDLQAFRLDDRTWQAILGIDLDVAPASYPISFEARVDGRDVESTIM